MKSLIPLDDDLLKIYANTDGPISSDHVKRMATEIFALRHIYRTAKFYQYGGPSYDAVTAWKAVKVSIRHYDNLTKDAQDD